MSVQVTIRTEERPVAVHTNNSTTEASDSGAIRTRSYVAREFFVPANTESFFMLNGDEGLRIDPLPEDAKGLHQYQNAAGV